jgi:hypothetical protein
MHDGLSLPSWSMCGFVGSNPCFMLIVENEKVAERGLPFKPNNVMPCQNQFGKGRVDARQRQQRRLNFQKS